MYQGCIKGRQLLSRAFLHESCIKSLPYRHATGACCTRSPTTPHAIKFMLLLQSLTCFKGAETGKRQVKQRKKAKTVRLSYCTPGKHEDHASTRLHATLGRLAVGRAPATHTPNRKHGGGAVHVQHNTVEGWKGRSCSQTRQPKWRH
jgi:hypothetical protein